MQDPGYVKPLIHQWTAQIVLRVYKSISRAIGTPLNGTCQFSLADKNMSLLHNTHIEHMFKRGLNLRNVLQVSAACCGSDLQLHTAFCLPFDSHNVLAAL